MSTLIATAHAKLNWMLDVVGRRPDGYHELDMLTQSLALHDQLTFSPAGKLMLWVDGIPCEDEDNLVLRAARLLKQEADFAGGAAIALSKNIPVRAGLGGGSADCAATLISLNQLWNLKLSIEELKRLGLSLGADVPFCLEGGLQRVRGIGEQMDVLSAPSSPDILVVQMDEGLSTGEVFRSCERHPGDASDPEAAIDALCRGDYAALGAHAANALTRAAIKLSPAVQSALILLSSRGALFARMTGSGSAVYGVFRSRAECLNAQRALIGRARCAIMTKTWPTGVDICG